MEEQAVDKCPIFLKRGYFTKDCKRISIFLGRILPEDRPRARTRAHHAPAPATASQEKKKNEKDENGKKAQKEEPKKGNKNVSLCWSRGFPPRHASPSGI
ncbi:hypothetical protein BO78DRAFT_417657 [Aspergillus sclerotiicarbonarius CBS 121057]|uniref:Uncharacterized protein n=1 Tax=Aspergillus sclerotiicarbonarius (strain CBS 121057 / IBT 28362) TaxID=1448318 RepID=A0A319ETX3_ASPSB|nr:hypothetical protein BO78DRAFT_417657 [Aspergillus sclerotiicarbonarius CBS 121057]